MELVGFKPHSPEQHDYLYSNKRFNIPCCGRRWGKSQAAGHRMTFKMFAHDTYNWIVGPTYTLGEKEFRVVYRDFNTLGLLKYCKKSYNKKQGDMRIQTPWDSVLEVVSAEKQDSLLGEGLSHAIMSEAAKHNRNTWEQYIEPALSDLLGSCDFPSTPQGFNWYHALWELGQTVSTSTSKTKHADFKSWRFPSWTNPIRYPGGLSNTEIQRIKSQVSKVWFDQEYGANFTSIAGSIYEEFDQLKHVQPVIFDPKLPNYLAFDYGYVNPFVALDIQVSPDDTVYVWREYYASYKATPEHALSIKNRDNPQGYHIDGMWGDPRGADEAATLGLILGHVGSFDVPWLHGVEQIKRMLKNGKLFIDPSCENLIRELSQLHTKPPPKNAKQDLNEQTGDGNRQHKINDHAPDALRYFIGPHFVMGGGMTLMDLMGQQYSGSESQDFMRNMMSLDNSDTEIILNQELSLGREF